MFFDALFFCGSLVVVDYIVIVRILHVCLIVLFACCTLVLLFMVCVVLMCYCFVYMFGILLCGLMHCVLLSCCCCVFSCHRFNVMFCDFVCLYCLLLYLGGCLIGLFAFVFWGVFLMFWIVSRLSCFCDFLFLVIFFVF